MSSQPKRHSESLSCIKAAEKYYKSLIYNFFCNYIQSNKACSCVCMSHAVFVHDDVSLPVFKVLLQRNATKISPDWGLALSLKNLIYCPLAICNSQFLCRSNIVNFASPSTTSSQCVSLIGAAGELNSAESLKEDGWRD